jgi:hypothetical protein
MANSHQHEVLSVSSERHYSIVLSDLPSTRAVQGLARKRAPIARGIIQIAVGRVMLNVGLYVAAEDLSGSTFKNPFLIVGVHAEE